MNASGRSKVLNHALFAIRTLDSSALTIRGAIFHRFEEPGEYEVFVFRQGRLIYREHLRVKVDMGKPQVDVDLGRPEGKAKCNCGGRDPSGDAVKAGGVMAFYATRGTGSYTVRIDRWMDRTKKTVLDSAKRLAAGDLFSATLIAPGTYRVYLDEVVLADVRVARPDPKKPHGPEQPILLSSGSTKAKESATLNLKAGNSIVLLLEKGGRVRVEPVDTGGQRPTRPPRKDAA